MEEKNTNEENISEKNIEVDIKENIQEEVQQNEKINETQSNPTKKKGIISKILGIFSKLLLIFVVVISIIIIVRALVFKKYDVFGYRFYLIMSGSMEPTIHVSDAVITKEQTDLQVGDIIAFDYQGATTVHRIVKEYNENGEKLYQTKGDNNNTEDKGLVKTSQIKGEVVYRIPSVGDAILFLQRNIVIILVLIIGVIIIVSLVRRLI